MTLALTALLLATTRIVSLSPATTEDLLEIGAAKQVVAIDRYATRPAAVRDFPRDGGIYDANAERILTQRPSLVVFQEYDTPAMQALRQAGLEVARIRGLSLDDDLTGIERLGRLSGHERSANALAARLRAHIDRVARRVARQRPLRVLVVEGDSTIYSVAKGSFVDDLLARANLVNVAHDVGKPWVVLSPEFAAVSHPDVIMIMDFDGDLDTTRPPWNFMPAAMHGRIVHIRETLDPGPYIDRLYDEIVRSVARYR